MIFYSLINEEVPNRETIPKFLNFGCGYSFREGWLNHDVQLPSKEILKLEVSEFHFSEGVVDSVDSFPSEHFEEIQAIMVLEHFSLDELPDLLYHLRCSLVKGGKIFAIVPNFSSVIESMLETNMELTTLFKATYHLLSPQKNNKFYSHQSLWTSQFANHLFMSSQFSSVSTKQDGWNLHITAIK